MDFIYLDRFIDLSYLDIIDELFGNTARNAVFPEIKTKMLLLLFESFFEWFSVHLKNSIEKGFKEFVKMRASNLKSYLKTYAHVVTYYIKYTTMYQTYRVHFYLHI